MLCYLLRFLIKPINLSIIADVQKDFVTIVATPNDIQSKVMKIFNQSSEKKNVNLEISPLEPTIHVLHVFSNFVFFAMALNGSAAPV